MSSDAVRGAPRLLLRLEGAVLLAAALWAYARTGYPWWMFACLVLLPDAGMLGYLASPGLGAATYNAVHTLTAPALLALFGLLLGRPLAFALALIWIAHIAVDRTLGYGLKYATGFRDTHLGRLGTTPAAR